MELSLPGRLTGHESPTTRMGLATLFLSAHPTKKPGSRFTQLSVEYIAIIWGGHLMAPSFTLSKAFHPMKWTSGGYAQTVDKPIESLFTTRASHIPLCCISEHCFTSPGLTMALVPGFMQW